MKGLSLTLADYHQQSLLLVCLIVMMMDDRAHRQWAYVTSSSSAHQKPT